MKVFPKHKNKKKAINSNVDGGLCKYDGKITLSCFQKISK